MPLPLDLQYFAWDEFKHPELVDADAAHFLDALRQRHGFPLVVTDDARMPEDHPSGSSPSSLHYSGRAFDLRWIPDAHRLFDFVECALMLAREQRVMLELELVNGPSDRHIHIGLQRPGVWSELLVRAD